MFDDTSTLGNLLVSLLECIYIMIDASTLRQNMGGMCGGKHGQYRPSEQAVHGRYMPGLTQTV